MIEVSVINESPYELPEYQNLASAGVDLKAVLDEALELKPLERKIIRTGLKIALPDGYEAQVRPRRGLAAKHGISILNAPGTIDSDYRGEIGVILVNLSNHNFIVKPGERIAQLVIVPVKRVSFQVVQEFSKNQRGESGFGSTGLS